nr:probable E3 ubiquitin-protein ligase LUL4 [Tanacetum cinerariifolium]
MGISSSNNRRRNNYYSHQIPPLQSYSSPPYIYSPPPPPPQLPPPAPPPVYQGYGGMYNQNYGPPPGGYGYGWRPVEAPVVAAQQPVYVDHQQAKKVKNHVNLHKDSLRVEVDEENPDCYLVSFVFDAMFDGCITIYYFAKEEPNCKFVPVYAEAFVPVKVPFQKGHAQRFKQPSGTGIDLGFFELDALSKSSSGEDVYPLVICAEINVPLVSPDEHHYVPLPNTTTTPHMQITQAVLEKNNDNPFKVKVMRQILWIDGVRYELREIYGISQSEEKFDDAGSGEECVICLTEPKNTAVLPCRHMCLCSECAKALRDQTNKCPICRQPIEELMEIKINTNDRRRC